jgi:hypothetical protein
LNEIGIQIDVMDTVSHLYLLSIFIQCSDNDSGMHARLITCWVCCHSLRVRGYPKDFTQLKRGEKCPQLYCPISHTIGNKGSNDILDCYLIASFDVTNLPIE